VFDRLAYNREYSRRYRQLPGKKEAAREYMRRWRYGQRGVEVFEEQQGRCALCEAPATTVDHNHETGAVRGALCNTCNTGLGKFGDDPARLRRAAEYLET